jgi:hypothetical protein
MGKEVMRGTAGILLLVIAVFVLLGAAAGQDNAAAGDNADLEARLIEAVMAVPGIQEPVLVTLADDAVEIVYMTLEVGDLGYRAEVLEVFRAVGMVLAGEDEFPPAQTVVLLPSIDLGEEVETLLAEIDELLAFARAEITRTAFYAGLEIEPGVHQLPDHGQGGLA